MTVPLGDLETPSDFFARVSSRNCRGTMRKVARDAGICTQAVIDGADDAIRRLAELAGANARQLLRERFRRIGKTLTFEHKGELFGRHQLSRDWVRVCPECVKEDIASESFRLDARPRRRSPWMIAQIRTCERHGRGLVGLAKGVSPLISQDFSFLIQPWLERIDEIEKLSVFRRASTFEHYVVARLERKTKSRWLDSLPMNVALQTCTLLGATSVHGPDVRIGDLGDDELWRCDAAGFEIAKRGEAGVVGLLAELKKRFDYDVKVWGPNPIFGPLYYYMANQNHDPSFDPVREIVGRFIVENLPVGPGDVLFRKQVARRRLHSVRTAAREYGIGAFKLKALLLAEGILPPEASELSFERAVFEAAHADEFIRAFATSMSFEHAVKYLNMTIGQASILLDAGILEPRYRAGTNGIKNHAFLPADLDGFLGRLLAKADYRYCRHPAFFDIPAAQKKVMCGADVIVRLILDGRLKNVGRRRGVFGYFAVLVDPEEIERIVDAKSTLRGLTVPEAARLLDAHAETVRLLISGDHIGWVPERNPKNGQQIKVVPREEVERFITTYISLVALTRARRQWRTTVLAALKRSGIQSAFPPPIHFYRRKDLERLEPIAFE